MALPAASGLGHDSYVAFAKESTYATTPAAADAVYEPLPGIENDLGLALIRSDALRPGRLTPAEIHNGIRRNPTARYAIDVPMQGAEHALRMILPGYSSAVVGGETVVIDHTFKEGALNSYTHDIAFGDVPNDLVTQLVGAYARNWSLRLEPDRLLSLELDLIGYGLEPTQTPMTAATYPAANLGVDLGDVLATAGNLKDGSGADVDDIVLRSFTIAAQTGYSDYRPRAGNTASLPPVRTGAMVITVAMELEYNSEDMMIAVQGGTQTDLKILIQLPATIGVASKRELEITAGNPKPASFGRAVRDAGVITQTVTWELAYHSAASSALVIRTRNLAAALT